MQSAIKISNLSKSFDNNLVLDDVCIRVPQASVYGFLGNNGAGKSTLIRILLGLLKSDKGTIHVNSQLISREQIFYRNNIGCLVDSACLYLHLTPKEFLGITCKIKSLKQNEIDRALAVVSMLKYKNITMDKFSLGMKQRVAIANALLGQPKLLILDEPTNGLDPEGMQEIRNLLRSLPEMIDSTVFLSSHLLDEIQKTASHIGILHQGKMVLESNLKELIQTQANSLDIFTKDSAKLNQFFKDKKILTNEVSANHLRICNIDKNDCAEINNSIVNAGFELFESRFNQASLETLFLNIVQKNSKEIQACS